MPDQLGNFARLRGRDDAIGVTQELDLKRFVGDRIRDGAGGVFNARFDRRAGLARDPRDGLIQPQILRSPHLHPLAQRLHLNAQEFDAARSQLIALELIAYQAPLYQVLALPGTQAATRTAPPELAAVAPVRSTVTTGPVSLAHLLTQLESRRAGL